MIRAETSEERIFGGDFDNIASETEDDEDDSGPSRSHVSYCMWRSGGTDGRVMDPDSRTQYIERMMITRTITKVWMRV